MKTNLSQFLSLSLAFLITESTGAIVAEAADPPAREQTTVLKWLGNAGWEIRTANTIVLIDPFLTRKEAARAAEWKTDEAAVLKIIRAADYVFAGHSHADHVGDVAFIAKHFGAKVIGSRTTTNLARTAGVDSAQLMTIRGGEKLDFKDFSVQVIESRHALLNRHSGRPKLQEIEMPWPGPITGKDFVEGRCFLYYFTFGKRRLLHQSTGNFIEENLNGLHPDIVLMAVAQGYDPAPALKILNPKMIILHHFDQWRTPLAAGIPRENIRRAQRFERTIHAIDREIKVITPGFLMTYPLE